MENTSTDACLPKEEEKAKPAVANDYFAKLHEIKPANTKTQDASIVEEETEDEGNPTDEE